jgi:hypothetical protein
MYGPMLRRARITSDRKRTSVVRGEETERFRISSSAFANRRAVGDVRWLKATVVLLLLATSATVWSVEAQTVLSARFNFTEEQAVGTVVGQIPTTPGMRYRMNTDSTLFALSDAGLLTTKARVDREALLSDNVDLLVQSVPSPPAEIIQVSACMANATWPCVYTGMAAIRGMAQWQQLPTRSLAISRSHVLHCGR